MLKILKALCALFTISAFAASDVRVGNPSDGGKYQIYTNNGGAFQTDVTVLSDGSVGIGTPSPATHLDVEAAASARIRVNSASGYAGIEIGDQTGTTTGLFSNTPHVLTFFEDNGAGPYIANTHIGVGTPNPMGGLHTLDQNPSVRHESDDAGGSNYTQEIFQTPGIAYNVGIGQPSETLFGVANKFFIYDGAMRFVVDHGKVGIGTTSPTTTLEVAGPLKATGDGASGNAGLFVVGAGNTNDQGLQVQILEPTSTQVGVVVDTSAGTGEGIAVQAAVASAALDLTQGFATIADPGGNGGNVPHGCTTTSTATGTSTLVCGAGLRAMSCSADCGADNLFLTRAIHVGDDTCDASCSTAVGVQTNTSIIVTAQCCAY